MVTDKSFHSLVQRIKDEEIPYFFQYVQDKSMDKNEEITPTQKNLTEEKATVKQEKHVKESNLKAKKKPKHPENLHNIKTSAIFGSLIENIFENTISNILTEAFGKEFSLTNRPRLIALPPRVSQVNLNEQSFMNNSFVKSKEFNTSVSPVLSVSSNEN